MKCAPAAEATLPELTRVIAWGHHFVREVLRPGDHAVDLTAGNGHDTLVLYQCVGSSGRVTAFDIQSQALERTAERLGAAGAAVHRREEWEEEGERREGVVLVRADHARIESFCRDPLRAVIANLGYRPGGDRRLVTRAETTVAALDAALRLLMPGGRLAVVVYVGHPGGKDEAGAVEGHFDALPAGSFQTLRLSVPNRPSSPYLLLAHKNEA